MSKRVGLAKNIIFNGSVQVTSILLNIILLPYVTKIFDSEALGINSFGQAIAGYFVLFGNLGITIYGARLIAETRDTDTRCQSAFAKCVTFQIFFNFIALVIYNIWAFYRHNEIYYLFSLTILTSMTDLSWVYTGKERFDLIAIRNLIIKIVGTTLIFIFVRKSNQLALFITLQQGILLLSNAIFWVELRKIDIYPQLYSLRKTLAHILLPSLTVFIPSIFSSLYLSLNKVMLGYLSTIDEVAIYDYPNRLLRIAITLVGIIGTVLMPRLANLKAKSNHIELLQKIKQLLFISLLCSVPLTGLFFLLSQPISEIFFHNTLRGASTVLIILSPTIITSGFSLYIIFVSMNRMKHLTFSVAMAGILNVLFNIIIIPKYGAIGAAFSTLLTECIVHIILFYKIRDLINFKWLFPNLSLVLFIGTILIIFCSFLKNHFYYGNNYFYVIQCMLIFLIPYGVIISIFYKKELKMLIKDFK